jgi:hypothetical protein
MSHIVTVQTRVRDAAAAAAACQRLGLPAPVQGTAKLYSGEATGLLIQLPGWRYPIVADTTTGTIQLDDFHGAWGDRECLDRFLQTYAVEVVRRATKQQGYAVTEQVLDNGSIKLNVIEGA